MKIIFFYSVSLLACFLMASGVNGADSESARELFIKSGLEKQMQDIGPALMAGYKNNYSQSKHHTAHDKKIYENIGRVIDSSFARETMQEKMVEGLKRSIISRDMDQILAWLNSPLGLRITELEKKAGSKEGVRESQKYIRNINKTNISAERIRLIKELNAAMDITETTIDIALSTQFALSMTTGKEKKSLSNDETIKLYEDFKRNRSRIEPMIRHQVHGSLLYTYKDLTDDELAEFVAFAQSENGKNYTRATSSVLLQTIIDSSLQFARQVSNL